MCVVCAHVASAVFLLSVAVCLRNAREPQGSSPPQSQPLSHPQIFVKGLPCDREGALADEAPGPRGIRRGRRRPSGFNFKGKGAEGECFAEEDASYSFAVRKGNSSHSAPVPM